MKRVVPARVLATVCGLCLLLAACSKPDPAPADPPVPVGKLATVDDPVPVYLDLETIVAIDIGHTPATGGATSARGIPEYEFNKRQAGELLDALVRAGSKRSFLINPDGAEITLYDRTRLAAAGDADLLLSIHHDSVQPHYLSSWDHEGQPHPYCDLFAGYSLLVSGRQSAFADSQVLAKQLGKQLVAVGLSPTLHHNEPIDGENRPLLDRELGIYQYDGLAVLRTAAMPAVLLECGIILNRDEEARLNDEAHRSAITAAVLRGVELFRTPGG